MKDQFILAHYAHCKARGAASVFLLAGTDTRILQVRAFGSLGLSLAAHPTVASMLP